VPNPFDFAHSPFNCLTGEQQALVRQHLQHQPMAAGQVLLAPGDAPTHLFVLIQGHVQQWDSDQLLAS